MTPEELNKMWNSAVFLDEPACSVVRELITEIRRLQADLSKLITEVRRTNPDQNTGAATAECNDPACKKE